MLGYSNVFDINVTLQSLFASLRSKPDIPPYSGRKPAPPEMYKKLYLIGYTTCQLVQDFFHQQYLGFGGGKGLTNPFEETFDWSKLTPILTKYDRKFTEYESEASI